MHGQHHVNTGSKSVLTSKGYSILSTVETSVLVFCLMVQKKKKMCSVEEILVIFMHKMSEQMCFTSKLVSIFGNGLYSFKFKQQNVGGL